MPGAPVSNKENWNGAPTRSKQSYDRAMTAPLNVRKQHKDLDITVEVPERHHGRNVGYNNNGYYAPPCQPTHEPTREPTLPVLQFDESEAYHAPVAYNSDAQIRIREPNTPMQTSTGPPTITVEDHDDHDDHTNEIPQIQIDDTNHHGDDSLDSLTHSTFTRSRISPPVDMAAHARSLHRSAYTKGLPNVCLACGQHIRSNERVAKIDESVTAHMQCFSCCVCATALEFNEFYYDGPSNRLYCHLDYHETFSERCNYCSQPIVQDGIFAAGVHWHREHFFCSECSEVIGNKAHYVEEDGLAVCDGCWEKKHADTCWKCRHKCVGAEQAISALERTWCRTCFSCEECTTPFDSGQFVLREDGTLVCELCEMRHLKSQVWR